MEHYGILSLIPIAFVLTMSIATRRVVTPLLFGAALSFLMLDGVGVIGGMVRGAYAVFQGPTLGMIVFITLLFGVLIELLEKSRAVNAFSVAIGTRVRSAKASLFAAWGIGLLIFIDDFLNAIVVGTTMKKVTDKYGVPRQMLAYITDVTAGPMAVMLPFSAWAVFFMSMFRQLGLTETLGMSEFDIYWHVIPFIFYAIIGILLVPLAIVGIIPPLGPMKKAYANVKARGGAGEVDLSQLDTGRAKVYHFLLPIGLLVGGTFLFRGDVVQGVVLSLLVTVPLFLAQRLLTPGEVSACVKNGIINMLPVTGIIFFSLLLVEGNVRLGTTDFIIETVSPWITGAWLPAISFLVVCFMAFTTGSFFGTAAIVLPIIVSIALSAGPNLFLVLGAVISGAVFGSHCCFFADATVLTATSCEIEPLDHALTQLPYGLISMAGAFLLYLALGFIL